MLSEHTFKHVLFVLFVLMMAIAGCAASPSARFYTLNSLDAPAASEKNALQEYALTVAVGPVIIPDYLDRPQIVTRTGLNELTLAEFDRWPGSLTQDISRVLLDNLSFLLREKGVSIVPWKRAIPSEGRVMVDISVFDINLNDKVVMRANWIILDKDGKKIVKTKDTGYSESVNGNGYDAAVAAMSKSLISLSRDIAEAIKETASRMNRAPQGK
jgi:hypothetical protein